MNTIYDNLTKTTANNLVVSDIVFSMPLKRILKRFSGLSLAQATPPKRNTLKTAVLGLTEAVFIPSIGTGRTPSLRPVRRSPLRLIKCRPCRTEIYYSLFIVNY